MTKTKDLIKQLKNQSILYIWSYPGYSHHFISWKQLPLFTKCRVYIFLFTDTVRVIFHIAFLIQTRESCLVALFFHLGATWNWPVCVLDFRNFLGIRKFGENYFFTIYLWGADREVLGTAPIPMCVGTVPQVLFAPYFPTKILLEHASVFLRGRGRAGEEGGRTREGSPFKHVFLDIQGMLRRQCTIC